MKETAIVIATIANVGTEARYFTSFENALNSLELGKLYDIFVRFDEEAKEETYIFDVSPESMLKIRQDLHPEIVQHDVEAATKTDIEQLKQFVFAVGCINKICSRLKADVMVRRFDENCFVFYAEKKINFGYEVKTIENAIPWNRFETPETKNETCYNFKMLKCCLGLDFTQMAYLEKSGKVVLTDGKNVELLKKGNPATEQNFVDFLERIEKKDVIVGYLNDTLYYC